MKQSERRQHAVRRETATANNVPYVSHLTHSIIDTDHGACICVLRLSGACVECADDDVVNTRHERLNRIVMGIADPRVTIWQHIVRRTDSRYVDGDFPSGYAADLNERYKARIGAERLMVNELYLTIVLRPFRTAAENLLASVVGSVFRRSADGLAAKARHEQVANLEDMARKLVSALSYYDAEPLEVYQRNSVLFSAPAEFLQFLVTGRWSRVPLAPAPIKLLIGGVRPVFGNEVVEVRNPDRSHYCGVLGIHSYPSETTPLFLDDLLTLPFEFVVTQSFQFKSKDAALTSMKISRNRMENAGDAAVSQIEELPDVADDLASRRAAMGAHHFNVVVKADTLGELETHLADLDALLTDAGIKPAREDLALEAAYWAQLPGVFDKRPRLSPINTRNLCGFVPFHNFPVGRRTGNHWGDALTLLLTSAGTPLYLSLHATDPKASNGGNKRDVAHTALFGPNGSGKTAVACFILVMLQKFGVTSVMFSKDRDTEIVVRRLRGKVYPLRLNEPTGLAPFALDPQDPKTRRHLQLLLRKMVRCLTVADTGMETDTKPLTVQESKALDSAIDSVLRIERKDERRLGRVLDFLPKGELYDRLARWCHAREPGREDGPLAWVFDNQAGTISEELGTATTTVFDTTEFIDDPELRAPMKLHLFHLVSRLIDGRRLAVFFSEFWKSMGDPDFAAFLKDLLKTLRKKNGFVVLDSQSLSDVINHPLARTLLEQVATMFLFPNPGADRTEHTDGFSLSEREYKLIKSEIPEGQGMFLLKQGKHAVVARLPLDGMEDDLAVLSARTANLALMDRLMAEHGQDADEWVGHFNLERKQA